MIRVLPDAQTQNTLPLLRCATGGVCFKLEHRKRVPNNVHLAPDSIPGHSLEYGHLMLSSHLAIRSPSCLIITQETQAVDFSKHKLLFPCRALSNRARGVQAADIIRLHSFEQKFRHSPLSVIPVKHGDNQYSVFVFRVCIEYGITVALDPIISKRVCFLSDAYLVFVA
jgi:hypothetical protein